MKGKFSNLNYLTKISISKIFFYLLILCLPFQTRKVFFTEDSVYYGYHVFYHTMYLYLTDLIFFGLVIFWILERTFFSREKSQTPHRLTTRIQHDRIYQLVISFWLILAISVLFSRENILGFLGLLKIAEFLLIFAYIREKIDFSREKNALFWLVLAILTFQAILGIGQYIDQTSFGIKILGEEYLRPGLRGVAEFVSHGVANPLLYTFFPYLSPISNTTDNIRAYGTLPHPNILAGLLFVGLIFNLYLMYVSRKKWQKLILAVFLFLISTGIVVTFSRFVWFATALAVILWYGLVFFKIRKPLSQSVFSSRIDNYSEEYSPGSLIFVSIVLLFSLAFNLFWFGQQIRDRLGIPQVVEYSEDLNTESSLSDRKIYNAIALKMIEERPFLGVGLRNFVSEMENYSREKLLPHNHQPVHNIFLLIAAESGILSLVVFVLLVYNIVRHSIIWLKQRLVRYSLVIVLSGLLFLGLFDHYLFTIQQGSLMLWLILGFLANQKGASTP